MKANYKNTAADAYYASLVNDPSKIPFAFTYGGERFCGFGGDNFTLAAKNTERVGEVEKTTLDFDFKPELSVSVLLTHYFSHGVTEWTVWFKNPSDKASEILESPEAVIKLEGEKPILKGILGDHVNYYKPYEADLTREKVGFFSERSRATHVYFPYFNLEYGDGGAMLVIGWAGTWRADFSYEGGATTFTASAVVNLKASLKPGECIRTALFVIAPYTVRDEHYATNYWRDWFIKHNLPKADSTGRALEPFSTCNLAYDTGLPNSDGSISENYTTWRPSLEKMIEEGLKVDFRWVDAGWYSAPDGSSAISYVKGKDWWDTVGSWELDPVKWPGKTFLESTDFARANGMKTIVWFEPERVTDPESLVKNYGYKREWAINNDNNGMDYVDDPWMYGRPVHSNNIGDPECLAWTTERICKAMRENKVEMYREDNNSDQAKLWAYLDEREGADRLGITECKFIMAHYKMWDDIIATTLSYGGCGFCDSCASGGGRNDLESLRRGVPLLRSDADRTTVSLRLAMTTTFNKWIPFNGANTKEKKGECDPTGKNDKYIWRASYLPVLNFDSQFVQDPDQDFALSRFAFGEWKKVSPYLLADFYVLTKYHGVDDATGMASYAYFDPEKEEGYLFAFRQSECDESTLSVELPFISDGERYTLTDEDNGEVSEHTGSALTLTLPEKKCAKMLFIKK